MNSTQGQSASPSRWLMAWGPLFLLQGIEALVHRNHIPFGIVQLLMGGAIILSLVRKRPAPLWIFTGILALWVISGVVEIALGRWVWGLFNAITGILVILVVREGRRQRISSNPT